MSRKPRGVTFKYDYLGTDAVSLRNSIGNHLVYSVGKDLYTATERDLANTVIHTVRDRLIERWMETMRSYYRADAKRVYYLSLEFLIGRTLTNSLFNLDIREDCLQALNELGLDFERLRELEPDAALGNGGLGRLAACFLDSMATLRLPGYGYGIRYEYGMFNQRIENGWQREAPENWLRYGNPWEFARAEVLYPVEFYGEVSEYRDEDGELRYRWEGSEQLMAMAYDTPIPGYATNSVNNMRLWSAKATREFNLRYFNEGDYLKAVAEKNESENLSRVLYPDDSTAIGRELRLAQQYFFVSASVQDILRRFLRFHRSVRELPDKVAIHLNDTHPSIAIPELMRILLDVHGLPWDEAWDVTRRTIAYTNHTLMPEALETWPVSLLKAMVPRHLQIIYEINRRLLDEVRRHWPGDADRLRRMSLIDEDHGRRVRMAHLAVVGSHSVNGVSAVHTELMKHGIFRDFDELAPDRIINITNGVTPRRWLNQANPGLSELISDKLGRGWITELDQLNQLEPFAEAAAFRAAFQAAKQANKAALAEKTLERLGIEVSVDSMFDVHIKRIHEYKRQLLNVLHVITRYNRLRSGAAAEAVNRTVIFAGKAAPGYETAKLIVKLIHDVAEVINNDPMVGDRLKVVFIPNYDVTTAADIIPAAELSEQISTAGTEASGTGNMKLALNGALTIGTLDGANMEIRDAVGEDNIFIFGLTADEVAELRRESYRGETYYSGNTELRQALDMLAGGFFSADDPGRYRALVDNMLYGADPYVVLADYADYVAAQDRVDALYRSPEQWTRCAVLNVARMGRFSSDRAVREYAQRVWGVEPVHHE